MPQNKRVLFILRLLLFIYLHFNISIILSCVYVSSFLDFISILIHLVDDLGTKVHLKWELNVFSSLKSTVTKNCSLHRICTSIMEHKHHLATECSLGSSYMRHFSKLYCRISYKIAYLLMLIHVHYVLY